MVKIFSTPLSSKLIYSLNHFNSHIALYRFKNIIGTLFLGNVIKKSGLFDKPFKVNVLTEAVSPNVVHDKCDAMMFGPNFECALSEDETEPKMQCIEDCGLTMYICDCNVYR